jgi:hypothetical protein
MSVGFYHRETSSRLPTLDERTIGDAKHLEVGLARTCTTLTILRAIAVADVQGNQNGKRLITKPASKYLIENQTERRCFFFLAVGQPRCAAGSPPNAERAGQFGRIVSVRR